MAINDDDLVVVRNLTDYIVGFRDQMSGRLYSFQPRQKMKVTAGVLRTLSYSSGGIELLQNYLSVQDSELCEEFGVPEDMIEYNWTVEDVDKLLLSGTMDELLDALDFGPTGIKEMIVTRAAAIDLPDIHKREAIQEKTGANISNIIAAAKTNEEGEENEAPKTRRRATKKTTTTTGRRASAAKSE